MLRYPELRKMNPRQAVACALVMRVFRQQCPCGGQNRRRMLSVC